MTQIGQLVNGTIGPALSYLTQSDGSLAVSTQNATTQVMNMANQFGISGAVADSLQNNLTALAAQYNAGSISSQTYGQDLEEYLIQALVQACEQGLDLTNVINDMPDSKTITVTTNYVSTYSGGEPPPGDGPTAAYHTGGMVTFHDGGFLHQALANSMITAHGGMFLANNFRPAPGPGEIDIRARLGEYVLRESAVDQYGVAFLNALNAGEVGVGQGALPDGGASRALPRSPSQNGGSGQGQMLAPVFHINVNGNLSQAQARRLGDTIWRQFSQRYTAGERLGSTL